MIFHGNVAQCLGFLYVKLSTNFEGDPCNKIAMEIESNAVKKLG